MSRVNRKIRKTQKQYSKLVFESKRPIYAPINEGSTVTMFVGFTKGITYVKPEEILL